MAKNNNGGKSGSLSLDTFLTCVGLVLALFCVGTATADFNSWTLYPPGVGGPWGGSVRQIISDDPSTSLNLWAATNGGIYYSPNGGGNWYPRNNGLESYDTKGVAICKANPNVMLASTKRAGLFTTSDGGDNWQTLEFVWDLGYCSSDHRDGTILKEFKVVAIDPDDCSVFYVGTDELVNNQPDDNDEHILVSRDSGASWDEVASYRRGVTAQIADDTNNSLFIGTLEGYVYKYESVYNSSTDGYDSTLTALNGNREFGDDGMGTAHPVKDLALPGADGSMIAVATGLGGLWVSPSGGGTGSWVNVYDPGPISPPRNFMNAVAADPLDANRLVFYGFDSQRTLFTALFETTDLSATLAAPAPEDTLKIITTPEKQMDIQDILITGSSFLLAEDMSGIFKWVDFFGSFEHSSEGLRAYTPKGFDFHPDGTGQRQGDSNMGVTGGFNGSNGNAGLNLWETVTSYGRWKRIAPTGQLPTGSGRLLRYTKNSGVVTLWTSVDGYGLYLSDENGVGWQNKLDYFLAYDHIYTMVRFPDTSRLLLGTGQSAYYSRDGGATWPNRVSSSNTGGADILLPDAANAVPTGEWQVARDIRSPLGAYASSNSQDSYICTTADAGVTWSRANEVGSLELLKVNSLASSDKVPGHLYAGAYTWGLFESIDGGVSWQPASTGSNGLPIGSVKLVDIAPWEDDILAAAYVYPIDSPEGIYMTGDGGQSWKLVNTGLEMGGGTDIPKITALSFTSDGTALVIGGEGIGLQYLETGSPPQLAASLTVPITIFSGSDFSLPLAYDDPDLLVTPTVTVNPLTLPPGATFDGTTLSWPGAAHVEGIYVLELQGSDDVYTVIDTVSITVNSSPLLPIGTELVATSGQELNFVVSVAGPPYVVTAAPLPAGATFVNEGTVDNPIYTFRWTPAPGDADSDVTFSVTDGSAIDEMTVTIAVNEPPQMSPILDLTASVGKQLSFYIEATDPDSDPLTYSSLDILPTGATLDADSGHLSWVPEKSQGNGKVYNITLEVFDGQGGSDQQSTTITVTGGASPPPQGGGGGGGGCFIQSLLDQ